MRWVRQFVTVPSVIVWVNGTFGVGKTTTGRLLVRQDPHLRLFDPEWVGYMVVNNLTDHDVKDFQDLAPWRRLTPLVADELMRFTGQDLVVVQTVLNESYWHELESGFAEQGQSILHVVLEAEGAVMQRRITEDQEEAQATDWRLKHLRIYDLARPWLVGKADLVLDTSALTKTQVADKVRRTAWTYRERGAVPPSSPDQAPA